MGFCKYCGKKVENGSVCPDCSSKRGMNDNEVKPQPSPAQQSQPAEQPVQTVSAHPVPVQPFNGGAPAIGFPAPAGKRRVNAGVVALLGLLGAFTVFTTIIVVAFT